MGEGEEEQRVETVKNKIENELFLSSCHLAF